MNASNASLRGVQEQSADRTGMPVHEPSRDRGDGWRELESAGEPVGTLAGSGRESLPSAPSADGTAGVDSNLRNSPRGGATTADGERQHGAPARRTQGGAGRHRSRSSSPGHGGSWARWSGSSGSGCRWDWRGRPGGTGGGRPAGTGWQSRERSGSSAVGAKGGRGPRRPCWRAGGRDVGPGPESGCRRRDGRRHHGEVERLGAGGASAGAWGAGDIPSGWGPPKKACAS
jgi:hypothetical protein